MPDRDFVAIGLVRPVLEPLVPRRFRGDIGAGPPQPVVVEKGRVGAKRGVRTLLRALRLKDIASTLRQFGGFFALLRRRYIPGVKEFEDS